MAVIKVWYMNETKDKNYYIDMFIKELIKNNNQYLEIKYPDYTEVHCRSCIFRFYNFEEQTMDLFQKEHSNKEEYISPYENVFAIKPLLTSKQSPRVNGKQISRQNTRTKLVLSKGIPSRKRRQF